MATRQSSSLSDVNKKQSYACTNCRNRKTKCDGARPVCSTCQTHDRACEYATDGPRRRSRVPGSRRALREAKRHQKEQETARRDVQMNNREHASPAIAIGLSNELSVEGSDEIVTGFSRRSVHRGSYGPSPVARQNYLHSAESEAVPGPSSISHSSVDSQLLNRHYNTPHDDTANSREEPRDHVDVNEHLGTDTHGNVQVRGPTNTLYESAPRRQRPHKNPSIPDSHASSILTSRTGMEQREEPLYKEQLLSRDTIEGVPPELVLHLLDVHWSRHHFFLITYRTAFYRDMIAYYGGARLNDLYYSPLLLFAIMAVSTRYSERPEIGGDHSKHVGGDYDFYDRAKGLLWNDMEKNTIPTATALLLMGNALMASGEVAKGWTYTGMGVRMVIHMGLHIEAEGYATSSDQHQDSEQAEIRRSWFCEQREIKRRLFWGAFVCEKLQSLYLGRPFMLHDRDAHVPKKFLDIWEERNPWRPIPESETPLGFMASHSVTTFTNLCTLAEICGQIMFSFYGVNAQSETQTSLDDSRAKLQRRLADWERDLPVEIRFTPWETASSPKVVPIHVIVLHTIFYSLLILLHRPFVANGHLAREEKIGTWGECTIAAEKIAHLLYAYRKAYTFRRIPYQLCYATYVASTILVRNVQNASEQPASNGEITEPTESIKYLAVCLKAFKEMKLAHTGSKRMLDIIQKLMGRLDVQVDDQFLESLSTASPQRSETLPQTDFESSNIAALNSRHIDIDTIQQSFPQSPGSGAWFFTPDQPRDNAQQGGFTAPFTIDAAYGSSSTATMPDEINLGAPHLDCDWDTLYGFVQGDYPGEWSK